MTALQVLRSEAALWGIAEEAVFAAPPGADAPGSPGPDLPAEDEGTPAADRPSWAGAELLRWLDLNA